MNRPKQTSWWQRRFFSKAFGRNVKLKTLKRRYRVMKWFGVSAILVLTLFLGGRWGLPRLPFFQLKNIVVLGEPKTLTIAEIEQQVGAKRETSLFSIDLQKVQRRIAKHSYFSSVQVTRRLPHTLMITVSEYKPKFILYTGRFYYATDTGKVFRDITHTNENQDYPIVTGFSETDLLLQGTATHARLREAAQLQQAYEKTPFAERFGLSEIHFEKNLGFTLYPEKKKYSIKFGTQDFDDKTKKLSQVLEELDKANVKFSSIDLNYPGKVLMTL